ncbi:MAG: EAL domain-containing protein [Ruminococcus sp.]|nr:EAL domain-containing protein [Ruminococcus sp.]
MSSAKKDRKKERVRLYKKVRNTSSWKSIILYLLMMLLFVASVVFLAGFVIEYIFESKFAEGYSEIEQTAKLYESGSEEKNMLDYIKKQGRDFIVTDKSGKVLYQQGNITLSDNSGDINIANNSETYTVYQDTETPLLYPNGKGGLDFKLNDLLEWYDFDAETVKIPIWVSVDISGGRQVIGKAYITINKKDKILIIELLTVLAGIIVLFCFIMFAKIIKSAINFRRVVKLFYSDPVTQGHNWMWYVRYGDDRLQSSFNKKYNFAVVNLVFRNYRNYCLCHSMSEGEVLLSRIDRLVSSQLKKPEMCAHATTSNFALLLKFDDEQSLRARLQSLIDTLSQMDRDHNFDFQIGVDIIGAVTTDNGRAVKRKGVSIETAYNNACAARATLGETEESGICIFDNDLLEQQRWRDIVHEHQQTALNNEEFVVYYQPKYDPRTNRLRGAEALVRWDSPEFGFVTPGRIIPIFEKNGFITEIDHYMIKHVAQDQKAWLDAGYECVPVSVNVSRAHFIENDLADQIRDLVDAADCPHELIEIELTESAFFDDKKAMIETIKKLKDYGFRVSMDDFGAGYSSLNSLKDMPLDVLKLDADFFRGDNAGERGEIVVSEAIKLAKSLDMLTVAEGVEEKPQVDFLAEQGCDMIQGYYFAKPMPKSEYTERMSRTAHTEQPALPEQTVQK